MSQEQDELQQHVKKFQKELNAGTVALMLLGILDRAQEPLYGDEISKQLSASEGEKQSAIYPVLRNLTTKKLLECSVKPSPSGPPRKYFSLSPLGKSVLEQWHEIWKQKQRLVQSALGEDND